MRVKDVMTTDVATVTPGTPLRRVAELLVERRISGLPVCDSTGRVIGVVSEHDLLFKEGGQIPPPDRLFWWLYDQRDYHELVKADATVAGEAMSEPAVTIAPTKTVAQAARLMSERRINRLPVVEDDRLVGIVTRADLIRVFARSDAEIAREIREDVLRRALWIADEAQVRVDDGVVEIHGTTSDEVDNALVERLVARVPGVVSVHSALNERARVA